MGHVVGIVTSLLTEECLVVCVLDATHLLDDITSTFERFYVRNVFYVFFHVSYVFLDFVSFDLINRVVIFRFRETGGIWSTFYHFVICFKTIRPRFMKLSRHIATCISSQTPLVNSEK
jgi:hypothetical protein